MYIIATTNSPSILETWMWVLGYPVAIVFFIVSILIFVVATIGGAIMLFIRDMTKIIRKTSFINKNCIPITNLKAT